MPPSATVAALTDCPLAAELAERLRAARDELTARWLDRIAARVALDPNRVFPTEELLNHVPLLLVGVADYVEDPAREIGADMPVVAKARELGELRHAQGFDAYQILKEYEILGGILFSFLSEAVDAIDRPCSRRELIVCTHRVFRAVSLIQQATATQFLQLKGARVREREARLRTFNRAITHELKNHLHAALGASELLMLEGLGPAEARDVTGVIARNLRAMHGRLEGLLELTRLEGDARQQRHVLLPQAAAEAVRQLREAAAAKQVTVTLAPDLPAVEVPAAAVELCLTNFITNAIKYHDPAKATRWVVVGGAVRDHAGGGCDLVVEVRDNGLGVPPAARAALFERFTRGPEDVVTGVEGTGLGLSIVRETVEALGGRAWAEFPPDGSVFAFSLQCRRGEDRTAAPITPTDARPRRPQRAAPNGPGGS
jgi:signal transduction histidine kinase